MSDSITGDNPDLLIDKPSVQELLPEIPEEVSGSPDEDQPATGRLYSAPRLHSAHLLRTPTQDPTDREMPDSIVLITELEEEVYPGKYNPDGIEDSGDDEERTSFDADDGSELSFSDRDSDGGTPYQTVTIETVEPEEDNEADWDTDLDNDDDGEEHDPTGRTQYRTFCEELGVVPISYFVRHITEPEIIMRYHGLGTAGTKAIALVLRDNVTLERLNLEGNWMGGEGGRSMGRMLEENDYITEVNLSDNKLSTDGAGWICKMLQTNTGLRRLNLADNCFVDQDTELFVEALDQNKYLRELNLSRNKFGQIAGEILGYAIAANDILDSLDLSWNHLRLKGGVAVAKGIQENVRLKKFRVAWNGLGPEGGAAFAEAMMTNNSLHELDISGNRLDAKSAVMMAKALMSNDEIKVLRMGNNHITTAGAIALVTAINNNESSAMEELDLIDVPVEFEFLRVVEDVKLTRPDFIVKHGPVLRAGNTTDDIGKPAIDPYKNKEPVVVLHEHIVVNDLRLLDVLKRYDPDCTLSVTPEDFLIALDELAVPYNRKKLAEALAKITDSTGKIYFGDFVDQSNRPISAHARDNPTDHGEST